METPAHRLCSLPEGLLLTQGRTCLHQPCPEPALLVPQAACCQAGVRTSLGTLSQSRGTLSQTRQAEVQEV